MAKEGLLCKINAIKTKNVKPDESLLASVRA
jgi:hypothetical protein